MKKCIKKISNSIIKIVLTIALVMSSFIGIKNISAENYTKGQVIDPVNSVGSTSTYGDVQLTKTVSPTETLGIYDVSINVKGRNDKISDPVYAVIIFDESGTMWSDEGSNTHTKYYNAVDAAVNLSKSIINNIDTSKVALVPFAQDIYNIRRFSHSALSRSDFPATASGTNIDGGLTVAYQFLSDSSIPSNAKKIAILITDGEPNSYMDEAGATYQPGPWVDPVKAETEAAAARLKEISTVYTVSYDLRDGDALELIESIATRPDYYYDSTINGIVGQLNSLASSIVTPLPAGTNATITDTIAGDFTYVDGSASAGVSVNGNTITYNLAEITEAGDTFSFKIHIDETLATGLYDTNIVSNDGVRVDYTDSKGNEVTKHIDNSSKVYWENPIELNDNITKDGTDKITSSNDPVNYSVNYSAEIDSFVGDAILKIVDVLPQAIDVERSSIGNGSYNATNNTITWQFNYANINTNVNGKFTIPTIDFNFSVVYRDLNPNTNTLVNNVNAKWILNNKTIDGDNDSFTTEADIKVGTLVVNYVDEQGNTLLPSETTTKEVGTSYNVTAKDVTDYDYVKTEGNPNGTYTNGTTTVTFVYKKQIGTLVVNYVDEQGNTLLPSETTTKEVGTSYNVDAADITNYDLVETQGETTGEYINSTKEITFIYRHQTGTVIVKYVDEDGNELLPSEETTKNVGEEYSVTGKDIANYDLIDIRGEASGEYTNETKEVVFVYRHKKIESSELSAPNTGIRSFNYLLIAIISFMSLLVINIKKVLKIEK